MKYLQLASFAVILIADPENAMSQGFVNLGFENTTITLVQPGNKHAATIPGWSWNTSNFGFGNSNSVPLNEIALDAPATTLQGLDSPYFPAIGLRYSVLLQGGSTAGGHQYGTNGASIFQVGQVPLNSQSLIYSGGLLQISFAGQMLTPVALSNTPNFTVWGVDISAFAGQSGELRFTKPWLDTNFSEGALLDNIRFSPTAVPEPSVLAMCGVFILCLVAFRKWPKALQATAAAP